MTQDCYHFIGIGGIGMSGLARILLSQQARVSGSDIASNYVIDGLREAGATISIGHASDNVPPGACVVYSSDIKKENPEYQHAIKTGYPLLHRSDLLALLAKPKKTLAVAGTHGKTTTTSLLTTVALERKLDPSFAIGGILPQVQVNARGGKGDFFILEADESDGTFLKYSPFGAIITNIDNDHLNHYGSMESLVEAFKLFGNKVEATDYLFWCGDDPYLPSLGLLGSSYGFAPSCDWRAKNFRQTEWKIIVDIEGDGCLYKDVEVALSGQHNALNALAVFGLSSRLGIDESVLRMSLQSFRGVLRRCERKGEYRGALLLDDYAHHPTEIIATLKGIRSAIQKRRLIAVFQPHRYTRTRDCLGMYSHIFDDADEVWVTDLFSAGELPIPGVSHIPIMKEIEDGETISCCYIPRSQLSGALAAYIQPNDVIVTLGAGDVTKVSGEIVHGKYA